VGKKKAKRRPRVPTRTGRAAPPAGWEAAKPPRGEYARLQVRVIGSDAWLSRVEQSVVTLVNEERRRRGLPALRADEQLARAARAHSRDMCRRAYLAHVASDGSTAFDRMRAAGYRSPASENIARGYPTPHAVMHGWMASPGHRANIIDPDFRAIGVGVAHSPDGPFWTQNFGFA
jgi:uncharacterized protein YkwD